MAPSLKGINQSVGGKSTTLDLFYPGRHYNSSWLGKIPIPALCLPFLPTALNSITTQRFIRVFGRDSAFYIQEQLGLDYVVKEAELIVLMDDRKHDKIIKKFKVIWVESCLLRILWCTAKHDFKFQQLGY